MSISSPPCLKSKAPHLYVSRPPPCCIPPQREFTCVGLREGRQAPPSMASFQAPGSGTRSRTLAWRLWETAMWLSCLHNRERALFFFFFLTCRAFDVSIMTATCISSFFWRGSHFLYTVEDVKYQYRSLHSWAEEAGWHGDPGIQSSCSLCLIMFLQPFTLALTKGLHCGDHRIHRAKCPLTTVYPTSQIGILK